MRKNLDFIMQNNKICRNQLLGYRDKKSVIFYVTFRFKLITKSMIWFSHRKHFSLNESDISTKKE